jgi:hypothetical protein
MEALQKSEKAGNPSLSQGVADLFQPQLRGDQPRSKDRLVHNDNRTRIRWQEPMRNFRIRPTEGPGGS